MLLPGLSTLPLIDRDEPRFAHATVEMMNQSEWIIPYFNEKYRFDKPPLTYWWMRAHFWLTGINEFGARLHSIIASLLCSFCIFGFARRLGLDAGRAFLAGAAWLTCLQVLIHSRMAVADMPLILCLILTMRALWELHQRDPSRPFSKCFTDPWLCLLGLSMGLGFLAKGPLAQIIPLLALLLWGGLTRLTKQATPQNYRRLFLYLLASAPLWFGLIAAWGIPALIATKGQFYQTGIGYHVVERGTNAFNSRLFLPGFYYLVAMLPFLLPWSPRLPETFKSTWRSRTPEDLFLLAWFLSPFLIFSFYATQLPHYILPGYPAFFLLLFRPLPKATSAGWFSKSLAVFCVFLPALAGLALMGGATLGSSDGAAVALRPLLVCAGLTLAALSLAALMAFRERPLAAIACSLVVGLLLLPLSNTARNAHLTVRLRNLLQDHSFDHRYSWRFNEPSLVWYFDDREDFKWSAMPHEYPNEGDQNILMVLEQRRWRLDGDTLQTLLKGTEVKPAREYRGTLEFQKCLSSLPAGRWEEVTIAGWSPATSSWIEVVAVIRADPQ